MHLLCEHTGGKRILYAPFKVREGFMKFLNALCVSDKIISQP